MDNRALFIEIALNLFAGRGYDAVGIQEVCAAARVTRPTLYYYFSSKRGLLEAVLADSYPLLLANLGQAAAYRGDLGSSLEQAGRAGLLFARERPRFFRLHLALQNAPPESEPAQASAPYRQEQQQLLETLFIQAAREYGGLRGRQRLLAVSFSAQIDAWAGLYLDGAVALNEPFLRQLSQQFLHGIL